MTVNEVVEYLKKYEGRPVKLMEVCGTHTGAILKTGVREHLSSAIRLVSGPGCPVCVTEPDYLDAAAAFAQQEGFVLATFGDMMRVPGNDGNLYDARSNGGKVEMIYSPLALLDRARENPGVTYVMAAVGFETTAPVYALLLESAIQQGISNIRLLTSIKTILPAMKIILENESIDGFICPGHVSAIIGSDSYHELADTYKRPFVIAGFDYTSILYGVYDLVRQLETGSHAVHNLYRNVVAAQGNQRALEITERFFEPCDAFWRGIGLIKGSGLCLKAEYAPYNANTAIKRTEKSDAQGCRCTDVMLGRIVPGECPLFRKHCTPQNPKGACMVSSEGACGIWYHHGQ